jgi:hypothetical protein
VEGAADVVRVREADAVVGLLRRAVASLLTVLFAGAAWGVAAPLPVLARDDAVGAKRPLEGVLARAGVAVGVLARLVEGGGPRLGREGVFAGVEGVLLVLETDFLAVAAADVD